MQQSVSASKSRSQLGPVMLIGVLFAIFGFVTWLNGTLIQFLKVACELNNRQASLVTVAFFISYFVMAIPSSAILRKTGFKNGMSLGLFIMAAGCLVFIPAANSRAYGLFLTGLFMQGLGLAILQTASNPYVTIVGPIESAAQRISIMGICNKLAGAIGAVILGRILLDPLGSLKDQLKTITDAAQQDVLLHDLTQKIVIPYAIMAGFLVLVGIYIRYSSLPDVHEGEDGTSSDASSGRSLWQHTYLWLGALAIFTYVGVEVLAGDYIIPFGSYLGVPAEYAKYLTSLTLFFMLGGYLLGVVLIPRIIRQETALRLNAIGGILFTIGVLTLKGETAVFCLAFLGFFHAVMWPAIWPLSIRGLGRFTKTGSALLIMGIAGGAVIPYIYGSLADIYHDDKQLAFWIMIPCYLYILFFSVKGYRIGAPKTSFLPVEDASHNP